MKRTFRIVVEYDGADLHGWQKQPAVRTVQGEIERALAVITRREVKVTGASRTDAGVHALGQVASFDLEDCPVEPRRILEGVNALTGEDITVRSVEEADGFFARAGVREKTYRYLIWNAPFPSPLRRRTHLHVPSPLDAGAMDEATRCFEGTHDFTAFCAAECTDPNTVRAVNRCRVSKDGPVVTIEVAAKGFLRNMVRIIAGTLLDVGKGKRLPSDIAPIIESRDRVRAGPTAPARGLVLVRIEYGPSDQVISARVLGPVQK